jgi:hypothetical protein
VRPLPDLTDLLQQPSVFNQSTDDFTLAFANEFAGIDSQQAAADQEAPAIFASMDPISAAIDALSSALDLAGSVLDLLSGDLDSVDLAPQILNFQGYDSALDSNLSSVTFDFTAAATSLFNAVETIAGGLFSEVYDFLLQFIQEATQEINFLDSEITSLQLVLQGFGGGLP